MVENSALKLIYRTENMLFFSILFMRDKASAGGQYFGCFFFRQIFFRQIFFRQIFFFGKFFFFSLFFLSQFSCQTNFHLELIFLTKTQCIRHGKCGGQYFSQIFFRTIFFSANFFPANFFWANFLFRQFFDYFFFSKSFFDYCSSTAAFSKVVAVVEVPAR